MKLVYTVLSIFFAVNCCAMDFSKIPLSNPWARKRVMIMALLDKNCKLSLPYEPQLPAARTIKKPTQTKARL